MTALSILSELREAGIRIHVVANTLKLRGPDEQLTPEIKELVAHHKTDLIRLLTVRETPQKRSTEIRKIPLSFAQERMLFLNKFNPDVPAYNMAFSIRISGDLNLNAFRVASDALAEKHAAFRTCFPDHDAQSIIDTDESALNILEAIDTTSMPRGKRLALRERLANQVFDLDKAPLIRLHLLKTEETEYELVLTAHHIVFDMRSAHIVIHDLENFYARALAGEALHPDAQALDYADFACWQRRNYEQGLYTEAMEYWKTSLLGAPEVLELPAEFSRPPAPTQKGGWVASHISGADLSRLKAVARDTGCTPFTVMFAAFSAYLCRISNQHDLVIGTPVDGRDHSEFENITGFFLNTLAIRCSLNDEQTFIDLLVQTRESLINGAAHQDLPFEKLVPELKRERDNSRTPVFQVMCAWHEDDDDVFTPDQNTVFQKPRIIGHDTAKFDLTLIAFSGKNEIETGFEYNADLFSDHTARLLLERFTAFLNRLIDNPSARVFELNLATEAELELINQRFNNTRQELNAACLHELVEQRCRLTPDSVAIAEGDLRLSYQQLNEQANRLASSLKESGIGAGKRVGIVLERGWHFPIALLATLKAGGAYVPIDPVLPEERLDFLLEDSDPSVLITHSSLNNRIKGRFKRESSVILIDQFDFDSGPADNLQTQCTPKDPAYVIYTSGSTGHPKGTMLTHKGLTNLVRWQATHKGLGHGTRTLHFSALCFDVSFTELFTTWDTGGTLIIPPDNLRQDFISLVEFLDKENIERLFLPCAALQPFAETMNELADDYPVVSFSDVIVSGEQLTITPAIRTLFENHPTIRLHNHYGPAETHVVTATTLPDDRTEWPVLATIGKPVFNTQIRILDQHGQETPIGVTGELFISGDQLGAGYLNRPELNHERYVADPTDQANDNHLYRTGDLARWLPDGDIQYCGRIDSQVKLRGYRIELGEVEAALMKLPAINQAAVAVHNPAGVNSGTARLVAWVEIQPSARIDTDDIRIALGKQLPDYMIPCSYEFLNALPKTPSGKIDRLSLPEPHIKHDRKRYVAPVNQTERLICECFEEVLTTNGVGILDDFFQLGGQSIIAMQLAARLHEKLGIKLPLKYLFQFPTPKSLANTVDTLHAATTKQAPAESNREEFRI